MLSVKFEKPKAIALLHVNRNNFLSHNKKMSDKLKVKHLVIKDKIQNERRKVPN